MTELGKRATPAASAADMQGSRSWSLQSAGKLRSTALAATKAIDAFRIEVAFLYLTVTESKANSLLPLWDDWFLKKPVDAKACDFLKIEAQRVVQGTAPETVQLFQLLGVQHLLPTRMPCAWISNCCVLLARADVESVQGDTAAKVAHVQAFIALRSTVGDGAAAAAARALWAGRVCSSTKQHRVLDAYEKVLRELTVCRCVCMRVLHALRSCTHSG